MLLAHTPVEFSKEDGFWVKREDLSCPPPGPPFSKTRGVYARVLSRPENVIGVLDTYHSQAGQAVARACQILGKRCINFYPKYKADAGKPLRSPQLLAQAIGAEIHPLQAGRSCILYHAARKITEEQGGYIMPNALKLEESVIETAKEVDEACLEKEFKNVIVAISSGTIAAGVIKGFLESGQAPRFILHMGYSRSHEATLKYIQEKSGCDDLFLKEKITLVDEKYQYKDQAKKGPTPYWPCNAYYDLKAYRWWKVVSESFVLGLVPSETLFWNIG